MIPGPQQQPGATEGRPGVVLTVCIFTYKRSHLLAKTLRAFQAQIAALGVDDLEVVVSDNASPDDTEGWPSPSLARSRIFSTFANRRISA